MEEIKEVSTIQDEDVLRQMWQETEDFSRKKEIRSHMYRLREARLKEFYTTGEVLKDVQRSNSSPGLRDQHPCAKVEGPTHADSLADHSFLSLKTKEIRDSESPTRDVQYRNSKNRESDGQWTITSNTSKSNDGKTITSSQLATTQGVRAIDGGQLAYAAANEHQATVFADGDDKNFTRSQGESSKTFAQQNVVAGDDNNFRTSKTTSTSSSSKVVTHHSSTAGETADLGDFERLAITGKDEIDDARHGRRIIYTSERPEEHFSSEKSTSSKIINTAENIRNVQDVKSSKIVYQPERIVSKTTYTSGEMPDDLKKSIADGNTKVFTETKTLPDGSTVTTTRYETIGSKKFSSTSGHTSGSTQVTSNRQTVEQKSSTDNRVNKQVEYITEGDDDNSSRTIVTTKVIRDTYDDDTAPKRPTNRNDVNKTESIRIIQSEKQLYDDDIKTSKVTNVQNECKVIRNQDREVIRDQDTRDVVKVTRTIEDQFPREPVPETKEIHTTVTTTKTVKSNVTDVPIKSPAKPKPEDIRPQPEVPSPTRSRPQERPQQRPQEQVKSCKPEETYKPTSPTDGQYSTTYGSEFTNKRISVDVSPTHDAFARSLRSISPDPISDRPKSRGSVRNSTSSLRSSISPEKHPQPARMSPERKPGYDRRSPDKYPDQKRHTTSPSSPSRPNDERKTPERKHPRPDSITVTRTTEIRRKPSSKSPERQVQSFSPARTPTSPTKTDVTITRTTKVIRNPSPTKPAERTSPLRSPSKEIAPINSDTITRKKKIPVDDERKSPVRSPTKTTTTEITVNTDTITRKKKVPEDDVCSPKKSTTTVTETTRVNSDTITRKNKKSPVGDEPEDVKPSERRPSSPKKPKGKITAEIDETQITTTTTDTEKSRRPPSRDLSPTSLASDIEFINHNRHIVTDLDEPNEAPRPSTLEITETTVTTKKIKPVSDSPKHPSSPVKESPRQKSPSKSSPTKDSPTKSTPVKEIPKKFKPTAPELDSPSEHTPRSFNLSDEDFEQVCEVTPKEKPPLKRTETYEERCREMLGLAQPEDKIPKKDYVDMYAGMEPVEEPMFTKKHVTPLGPIGAEDELMYETVKKIHERRPEYPDAEIEPTIEDFIVTEKKDAVESEKKPKPTQVTNVPGRKSPEKQKKPKGKQPDDGEYNTEYTDEYCDKPSNKQPITTEPKDKKQIPKASSPQRKSPEKKLPKNKQPSEGEYNTEYTDEYGERPEKPQGEKVTTTVDKKPTTDKKSPERKPQQSKLPQKKRPEDMEFSTEYTDEYCEITGKIISTKKPAGKKNEPQPKANDIAPVRGIPSPTKRTPEKKSPTKKPEDKPEESTDDEQETVNKIHRKSPSPVRRIPVLDRRSPSRDRESPSRGLPENITVTEYINEYNEGDFINKEKYDTSITLEKKPPTTLIDIEFDLENQTSQDVHIRTHRIDTTYDQPRETSPRRQPQRAVPSDTMECTFKKTTTEEDRVTSLTKKQQPEEPKKKPQTKPEDRKSPVKQINRKDSAPKTTTTKTIIKKVSSTDIDTKRKEELPKRKIPKERSPERYERPNKARSPSPTCRTVLKNERNVSQVTRKTSSKDIPIKKVPTQIRKPLSSPATSPERKPSKPFSKATSTQPSSKHVVTKTISLKPQPSSPVKSAPKNSVTTKVSQPSSVTVTTVRTTKTTKKTIKPQKIHSDSSDSEIEPEVVDKKKVVTTANIKISNGVAKQPKEPNVSMPYYKVNTNNVTTVTNDHQPSTDSVTKCITTKSIILNQNDLEDIEFVIDLQRSTSSREPSPDKICPIPVSSEDEGSYPRYPDQVSEPDDLPSRRKPAKIADIPLTEEEDVKNFSRFTEVTETTRKPSPRITDIDKVTETDESLLSVTEKVSRFITTAEKLTEDEPKSKKPAPKVPRPELMVDENLEDDECLLSVSDKVTKFITTADHIATKPADRQKSPRPRERTPVDVKINENDECLLSVNQKVSHFIQAAETVKHKPSTKEGPAPKVSRPNFTVDDTLKTDECLLSVSDKVSKFLTSAEKLTTTKTETTIKREPSPAPRREYSPEKTTPKREFSPEKMTPRRESPEKMTPRRESPEKITKREPTPEKITKREPTPEIAHPEPKLRQSPIRKTPETYQQPSRPKSEPTKPAETKPVNLKSSEAVRKAKAMFENISKTQEVPKQRDILSRPSIWEGRKKPEVKPDDDDVKLTDIGVYKKKEPEMKKQLVYSSEDEETCKRISTNLKDVTLKSTKLILNEKPRYLSPEKDIPGYMKPIQKPYITTEVTDKKIQRSRSPNPNGELPGYMQPLSKHSPEDTDRPIQRSRSPNPNGEVPGYMRPIHKLTQEERNKYIIETRNRETYSPEREELETHRNRHYENGDIPHYMLPLQRNVSPDRERKATKDDEIEIVETVIERHRTPERDVPGYMRPLQRHVHSPDREERRPSVDATDDGPRAGKKFGVTLRRTDSGRMVQTTATSTIVTERRRSSTLEQQIIEDIQDLEVLERMMDKVVGYEQRRRIRAQIRVVKKLISENKIQKRTKQIPSPVRDTTVHKPSPAQCTTTPNDRRSPMRDPKRSSVSPSKKTPEIRQKSPEPKQKSTTIDSKSSFSTTSSQRVVTQSTKERSISPEPKKRVQPPASMYKPDLKPIHPASKTVQEDKPSWVTNRNLKKTTSETVTTEKRVVSPKRIETILRRSPSPQKDSKPTDCITSSYGIGPTDENGQPLFGIRALRKATNDSKVHVRGTVVTSQFYSENGQEPVGEVTVTKYSNNPRELNVDDEEIKKSKGLASVTTTQKFGSRGTPTLSSIVDKKKAITDKHTEEDEIFKTTSTKVTRRGSVKALSQKFIENAVEISRNERQNYPKAGLILRTSSFKDSTQTSNERNENSSRESSPGLQSRSGKISLESMASDSQQESHIVQDTSTTTKTFLNSHTRVANAQEVISRMKNAEKEHQEGDSPEDREARMLLNKFLGAQVLMSGMEPLLSKSATVTTSTSSSASAQLVRKIQKTKTTTSTTTKETSKPVSLTKRFQTPITTEVLQDIWDEQTLRALLEQCTDYEERRAIRARLRQVMAEQEAVANVVANAVSESGDRSMQERIERSKKSFPDVPVSTTHVSTTRMIQARQQVSKPASPFAKFRQLDKQNSLNTQPSSPRTPTGTGAPMFKFTDPALSQSASTVKDRLLHWCQIKTKEYQNIKLENFSTCWADGMAFCALIHHFLPDAFDYHALNPKQRRHNFTLAFKVADEQADIAPLLDVDDMVAMRRPDWKCVFTYVQSIYRRFKDED